MSATRVLKGGGFLLPLLLMIELAMGAYAQTTAQSQVPEIHQLMKEVLEHQRDVDKPMENYAYTSVRVTEDLDSKGKVTKTERNEFEIFFVNGRGIARKVKRNDQPLTESEEKEETERVTKEIEMAQKPELEKPEPRKTKSEMSLAEILESVEIGNPRQENYHGRPTYVFDIMGRKDLKAHDMSENVSKKLQGTVWIDVADRVVAHLDVSLNDDYHIGGGLLANIEKGSNFHFEQGPVYGEVWLSTGSDMTIGARLFLVKGVRQHIAERKTDFKRFNVDAQQGKDVKAVVPENRPY
jgi:hypothetical protein